MAITVVPGTMTIEIPQSYLSLIDTTELGTEVYELDLDTLRLDLKAWEDDEEGMALPITHTHNTTLTVAGLVLDRVITFTNGWIVDFEDTGTPYIVSCTGANSNISEVTDLSAGNVALLPNLSAGRTVVEVSAAGLTKEQFIALQKP